MREFLLWWLVIEAVGLASFPLTYAFFRRLPDGGFAFAKPVGLLLLGYGLWMGATIGLFPYSRGSALLVLLLIAGLSTTVAGRYHGELVTFLRSGWRYIALVEVLFLAVLAAAVYLRSFVPEIAAGEKPFELAFLNAIHRSDSFPPQDPWLAGHSISYYYLGYIMVSALSKLADLETDVTFYLSLCLMVAMAAVAAFGLVYNMISASRREEAREGPALIPRAALFGLAGAALMLIVSNLAGVFELLARYGVGSRGFYGLVGIYGLEGPYDCGASPGDCAQWYPTRFLWWWWPTRMGSPSEVQEFPFFSFHFGDLHPHVLAMPFLITLMGVAFLLFLHGHGRAEEAGGQGGLNALWWLRHPWRLLLLALLLGGVVFIDAWTLPLAVLILVAAAAAANGIWLGERGRSWVRDTAGFALPLVVAMVLLYLPYYLTLEGGQVEGIRITQASITADSPPPRSEVTRPLHFLLFWTPLLWATLPLAGVYLYGRWREAVQPRRLALAASLWAAPLGLWALIILGRDGFTGLADELAERGGNLITLLILIAGLTAVALAFLHLGMRPARERDTGLLFAFGLMAFALLMLLGAELYFVKDLWGWRLNTVFRFWHQGWIILSIAGGFALYRLTLGWRRPRLSLGSIPWDRLAAWGLLFGAIYTILVAVDPWDVLYARWWTATLGLMVGAASVLAYAVAAAHEGAARPQVWRRLGWIGATAIIGAAALLYPVLVTFDRTDGFRRDQSLNGLVHIQRNQPLEYEAIQWLRQNVQGQPVILEAVGRDFTDFGRVSSLTGLPTVIGWVGHELQWRGRPSRRPNETPWTDRPGDVDAAYTTLDIQEAKAILRKYDVRYVYVGSLERQQYDEGGLAKFGEFMIPVFENEEVTIYRMPTRTEGTVRSH